jgi:hypothetical protein
MDAIFTSAALKMHADNDVRAEAAGVQPGVTSTSAADYAEDDDHDSSTKAVGMQHDATTASAADDTQDDEGRPGGCRRAAGRP